jgi:hypothetical protein
LYLGVRDLAHQARVLELVAVYIEVVEWFINVGLLPEFPCEDLALVDDGYEAAGEFGPHRVPYPASVLAKIYQGRYMFVLNVVFLNVTCVIFIQIQGRIFSYLGFWRARDDLHLVSQFLAPVLLCQ